MSQHWSPAGRDTAPKPGRAALRAMRRATTGDCASGKKRYTTLRKARLALDAIRQNPQANECAIYECAGCSGFHLTSQEPRRAA